MGLTRPLGEVKGLGGTPWLFLVVTDAVKPRHSPFTQRTEAAAGEKDFSPLLLPGKEGWYAPLHPISQTGLYAHSPLLREMGFCSRRGSDCRVPSHRGLSVCA